MNAAPLLPRVPRVEGPAHAWARGVLRRYLPAPALRRLAAFGSTIHATTEDRRAAILADHFTEEQAEHVGGVYIGAARTAYVFQRRAYVVLHEAGHALDHALARDSSAMRALVGPPLGGCGGHWPRLSMACGTLASEAPFLSAYACTSPAECFADAVATWCLPGSLAGDGRLVPGGLTPPLLSLIDRALHL